MAIKTTKSKVAVSYESDDNSNLESEKESNSSENEATSVNPGWADSIAKILKTNKPKGKSTLVLSKAKKLTDLRAKAIDAGYEIQTEDGVIQQQTIDAALQKDSLKVEKSIHKKKDIVNVRKKPNILEKDRERTLSKIATKGVVQLFNAVKKQQKEIDTKLKDAGTLEVKRDRVLKNIDKREFLNVLRGDKHPTHTKPLENAVMKRKESDEMWSVLRDDFMMSAKMKDWDKELEIENEMEIEQTVESD